MFKKMKNVLKSLNLRVLAIIGLTGLVLAANNAMAIVAPAPGSFAFTFYDFAVVQGVQGALGFVGGICAVLAGVGLAIQNKYLPAAITAICGAAVIGAPQIVTSMGCVF